jgi:hypothetical protein
VLRITAATAFPASQAALLGLRVAVNSQDTAVVLGPVAANDTLDPGPALTWIPFAGPTRQKLFPNEPTPAAMALDGADAIWLTGQLYKGAAFGGTAVPAIDSGYYLVKLGADGSNVFTKGISRTDSTSTTTYALAFDSQGNVYVTGNLLLNGTATIAAVFVSKFSPTGALLSDRVFAGTDTQASAFDAAISPNGDLVIVGDFSGSLQVGTTKLTSLAGTSTNGFVAVLNTADLTAKRAFSFGGPALFDLAYAVDVTSTGALRISGTLCGMSTVGGTTVQANAAGSPFVAELTPTGTANWVRLIEGPGVVFQSSTSPGDRTFAVGRIDGTTHDAFLAAIGPDNTLTLPLRTNTGENGNGALSAATDHHGGVWVAGELQGTATFGTTTLGGTNPALVTNFLVHLEP